MMAVCIKLVVYSYLKIIDNPRNSGEPIIHWCNYESFCQETKSFCSSAAPPANSLHVGNSNPIVERVGSIKYCLQQLGRCTKAKTSHINLLKKCIEPVPTLRASFVCVSGPPELVQKGHELTTVQVQELTELEHQSWEDFSQEPMQANIIQHYICTPLRVVVLQWPY